MGYLTVNTQPQRLGLSDNTPLNPNRSVGQASTAVLVRLEHQLSREGEGSRRRLQRGNAGRRRDVTAQQPPAMAPGRLARVDADRAIDEHHLHAFGLRERVFVSRDVAHARGSNTTTSANQPARSWPRSCRRKLRADKPVILCTACSMREQLLLAPVARQHARERAPQARVRMLVVRQAVGADHAARVRDHAPHIVLVHLEVAGAAGLQAEARLALRRRPTPRRWRRACGPSSPGAAPTS